MLTKSAHAIKFHLFFSCPHQMEKIFLRVWRAEENEALFNAASIAAAIEASPPSGKGLKEDYLALVKSMGVAIHPSLVPRAKLIADVLPEDALETVLDMTPYESMVSVVGTVLDRPSLCLLCEALTTATNIKTLKLVDVGLTSSSVSILAEYLPKLSVETLVLDFNNGPWKDSSSLASLILPANATPVCPLKVLSLRGCGIDDAIADNIAEALWINTSIVELNLFQNRITDASNIINVVRYNHAIKSLWLGNNSLGHKAAMSFYRNVSQYGPLSAAEKEERAVIKALHEKFAASGGGKPKKGAAPAVGFSLDEMDEESGICVGNQNLVNLDLTFNPIGAEASAQLQAAFCDTESPLSSAIKQFNLLNCTGVDDATILAVNTRLGRLPAAVEGSQ
jgi:hypothetical protein